MRKRFVHAPLAWAWATLLVLGASGSPNAAAMPPSEKLLPGTTHAFAAASNVPALASNWEKTDLHKLFTEPTMRDFVDDLEAQLEKKWTDHYMSLGLSVDDWQGIATGEISFAFIGQGQGKAATVVLANITGEEERAKAALDKAAKALADQGAKRTTQTVAGVEIVQFEMPPKGQGDRGKPLPVRRAAYFLADGMLVGSSNVEALADIATHRDGNRTDSLSAHAAYQAVMKRCREAAGDLAPEIRWFVDPFAVADVTAAGNKDAEKTVKIFRTQGFSALQGLGGFVNFNVGEYQVLHRSFVYAPPPYELAMGMAALPNRPQRAPEPWVPRDVASYVAVQWDVKTAFERFSTLFDQLFGEGSEGVFEETIRSTRDDPNGPGIDIRVDLVGHLGERAAIISDYKLPIDPTSERMVFVVETTDERALADAVRRSLENDPEVFKIEHGQFVIWEMRPIQEDVPEIVVDNAGEDLGVEEEMEEEVKIPNSAVAVAKGNLFISSHVDFLKRILDETAEADQLANDVDYKLVMEKLDSLGAGESAVRTFARGDERIRPTYELFKAGKLPESDTLIASVANAILGGDEEEGVIRKPALDGSKLPDFQVVRRYLSCGGAYVSTQDQGWLIVGMTLGKTAEE